MNADYPELPEGWEKNPDVTRVKREAFEAGAAWGLGWTSPFAPAKGEAKRRYPIERKVLAEPLVSSTGASYLARWGESGRLTTLSHYLSPENAERLAEYIKAGPWVTVTE